MSTGSINQLCPSAAVFGFGLIETEIVPVYGSLLILDGVEHLLEGLLPFRLPIAETGLEELDIRLGGWSGENVPERDGGRLKSETRGFVGVDNEATVGDEVPMAERDRIADGGRDISFVYFESLIA